MKPAASSERQPSSVGDGNDGESLHRALQERLQCAEGCLAVLDLRQHVVGLEALQPDAGLIWCLPRDQ